LPDHREGLVVAAADLLAEARRKEGDRERAIGGDRVARDATGVWPQRRQEELLQNERAATPAGRARIDRGREAAGFGGGGGAGRRVRGRRWWGLKRGSRARPARARGRRDARSGP